MMQETPSYIDTDKLVQTALAKVRAICKGNGVKVDAITVKSHKITSHITTAGTYLELKPVLSERQVPGKIVAGQAVGSHDEATAQIDQAMLMALRDPSARAQISDTLLRRADKGFGLNHQSVPIDFLKREYTWHEGCSTCHSTGKMLCQKCQGRRVEACIKCASRGLMPCPTCMSSGIVNGNRCPRCSGQRFVPCDVCNRTGVMPCRVCSASGSMKCTVCGGVGWKSHIMTLTAQAMTYFEYDRKAVPGGAADVIETGAASLVTGGHAKVTGRQADDKENALGASYEVEFPYGEIIFMVGKREVKSHLFGYKADLPDFPDILDTMLKSAVLDLERAAADIGSVAEKIKQASRYRLIAQAFLVASRTTTKKTVEYLLKNYDIGLGIAMAEKIAVLADQTTSRITRKPRYYGLGIGLLITAALTYAYYLLPLRTGIAAHLPTPKIDFILDIIPLIVGCVITTMSIQLMGANAIRRALGHLIKPGQKSTIVPKTRSSGLWGYAGVLLITLGMIEASARMQTGAPYWYDLLRGIVLRLTGS